MKIHRAGVNVILSFFIIEAILFLLVFLFININVVSYIVGISLVLLFCFVIRFFRDPQRKITLNEKEVIAPADGKVVVIEEIEDVYTQSKRIQVSIFMSVWNVHINWLPVLGKVISTEHIDGKFMVAKLPKSSHENERSVTILESAINGSKIVVKQIAGTLARRIITYVKAGDLCAAGDELGFIRFGSRVDVLLPLNYDINVKLGEKVVGGKTILANMQ